MPSIRVFRCDSTIADVVRGEIPRPSLLIRIEHPSGAIGWGEAAPLDGFGVESWSDVQSELDIVRSGDWALVRSRCLRFGLECAMMPSPDWIRNSVNRIPESVPLARLLGAEDLPKGTAAVKLKVGRSSIQDDVDRVQHVLNCFDVSVRLDANRSLSVEDASKLIECIPDRSRLEFFEEPLQEMSSAKELVDRFGVRIGLDETLLESPNPMAMLDSSVKLGIGVQQVKDEAPGFFGLPGSSIVAVVKPSLFGGLADVLQFLDHAQSVGCPVVISSAYETPIGMTHVINLAAHTMAGSSLPLNVRDIATGSGSGLPSNVRDIATGTGSPLAAGLDTMTKVRAPGIQTPDSWLHSTVDIPDAWPHVNLEQLTELT